MVLKSEKAHAVCVPFPAQGHINPMLKLAKLLHHKGFHITFVLTEFNHQRLLKSGGPNSLDGLTDFQFRTIPDGLPPPEVGAENATQDLLSLCDSTSKHCLEPFLALIEKLTPKVGCIVSDGAMPFTLDAAEALGIPDVLFWTPSACGFLGYLHYKHLLERGVIPLKDESYLTNGYLDTIIDSIPGLKNIRLRDLPSFVRTTDKNDKMVAIVLRDTEQTPRGSAVIVNTFEELEADAVNAILSLLPSFLTIGPLHLLLKQLPETSLDLIESSMWTKDHQCIGWLDSKEPKSVVYVNFGSIANLTPQQMQEFAWGLANSNKTFLWIIRPDLVKGDSEFLEQEFLEKTKDRSFITSWCPQEQVLSHPSIGGFLTHSGWNSTIESICAGVPMICWPFFAEQQTNCWFARTKWDVGMEIDNNVKRDEVEGLVRELMEGEKGNEMRKKATEWKRKAEKSIEPNGSSFLNLEKLVNEVLLL